MPVRVGEYRPCVSGRRYIHLKVASDQFDGVLYCGIEGILERLPGPTRHGFRYGNFGAVLSGSIALRLLD